MKGNTKRLAILKANSTKQSVVVILKLGWGALVRVKSLMQGTKEILHSEMINLYSLLLKYGLERHARLLKMFNLTTPICTVMFY